MNGHNEPQTFVKYTTNSYVYYIIHRHQDIFMMDNIPANSVDPEELVNLMKSRPECTLILDSRSFMSYNENHIIHSENVHCPPIVKRRSGGFVALENIVPCEVKRKQLENGVFRKIVVYDTDTCDLTLASKDSNLYSVLKSLRQQLVDKVEPGDICYLKGGFCEFHKLSPQLCEGQSHSFQTTQSLKPDQRVDWVTDQPVEILPHLYLGNFSHASQLEVLQRLGITSLMNVSKNCKNCFEDLFEYMTVPVDDNDSADLSSWFDSTIAFIDHVRDTGGRVLVHCRAGVSRSVTICLAYLMFTARIRLEAAFEHVRSKRSMISPSLNFMRQLEAFEKELDTSISLSTSSSDISMASSMDSSRDISSSDSCSHSGFEFSKQGEHSHCDNRSFDFSMSGSITSPTTLLLPS